MGLKRLFSKLGLEMTRESLGFPKKNKKNRSGKNVICLNIGHHPGSNDYGAYNHSKKLSEYAWNESFVNDLAKYIEKFDVKIVNSAWHSLPRDINATKAKYCVSFHCNAFNGNATGTETLYYEYSSAGKALAREMNNAMVDVLDLPDRGVKGRTIADRGGALLQYTSMSCILIEPFFIDNDDDLKRAFEKRQALIEAIAEVINSWS